MYIKVQDKDNQNKYHIEASYIKWTNNGEIYPILTRGKTAGSIRTSETEVANMPSIYVHLNHGDTVYVMNNDGKTIDKKHIDLVEEKWTCPKCGHLNLASEEKCTGRPDIEGSCWCPKPEEAK